MSKRIVHRIDRIYWNHLPVNKERISKRIVHRIDRIYWIISTCEEEKNEQRNSRQNWEDLLDNHVTVKSTNQEKCV